METQTTEAALFLLKALADESRLALLRYLAGGERAVGDLARQVELGEPTVSHHLARLREAGFVTLRMAGNQRFYRLNPGGLDRFKRIAANIERLSAPQPPLPSDNRWIDTLDWDAEDRQVLIDHTYNGRLTRLPGKQKNLLVILRWLATLFEPGRRYSEAEVNDLLKTVYAEDYVSLRRGLVDMGYLRRERGGGKYWLAPDEPENDKMDI